MCECETFSREWKPKEVRELIRKGEITWNTAGMCKGYAQANLVIIPKKYAFDFMLFTMRNREACPVLEVTAPGEKVLQDLGEDIHIDTDFPKYRIYEYGIMTKECTDIKKYWREDFVSFLIGCSFSFEGELLEAKIPIRHIEQNKNVPMYITNIPCKSSGIFKGNMVVSMRPIPYKNVVKAVEVTSQMPNVHGAPIHIGNPEQIGISNIDRPDFGEQVITQVGDVPVFWPCGVTPQVALMNAEIPFAITHAPGHMLITDIPN